MVKERKVWDGKKCGYLYKVIATVREDDNGQETLVIGRSKSPIGTIENNKMQAIDGFARYGILWW